MASVQELSGQQEKALELFKSAFQAFVLTLGKLHPRTIQTAEWIGDVLYRRALNSHKIGWSTCKDLLHTYIYADV